MSVSAAFRTASAGWASLGACRDSDPDLFFPIASSGPALQQIAEAKAVCARCPVRVGCLSYALETGQDAGMWGGASAEEPEDPVSGGDHLRGSAGRPARPVYRDSVLAGIRSSRPSGLRVVVRIPA